MKLTYLLLLSFLAYSLGMLFTLFICDLLVFVIDKLFNLDWLFTQELWGVVFKAIWERRLIHFKLSIMVGSILSIVTVAPMFDAVFDLRKRRIGISILVLFQFCILYFLGLVKVFATLIKNLILL
jgi:hypothetical protein